MLRAKPMEFPGGIDTLQKDAGALHLEHLPGGIVDDPFDALPHGVHVPAMLDHIIVKPEPPVPTARIERRADLVPTANADPVPRQHALGDASASSEEPAPRSRIARAPARLLYFIEETGEDCHPEGAHGHVPGQKRPQILTDVPPVHGLGGRRELGVLTGVARRACRRDQLRHRRKTATIRLGDKSGKYRKGLVVCVLAGQRFGVREKIFDAVVDKVEVKPLREVSPREIQHDNPEMRHIDEFVHFLGQLYNREVTEDDTVTVIHFSEIRAGA